MSIPAKKISASSRAMDTFVQSEQLFRVLIEKSSDAIALLDRNGMVLYASPSTTRVLGYTSEEFVGHSTLQLIHPDDLEQTTHALAAVIEEPGKSLTLEYRLLALLFEKFVRLKRDTTGTVRGTGLGLYISKHLVEAMGGSIWVESTGREEEGSRFCFTLPVAADAFLQA